MSSVIDITKPPYEADNTGQRDASEVFMEAIRDLSGHGEPHTKGGKIFMPAGVYRFAQTVDVTNYVIIEGEGGQHHQYWFESEDQEAIGGSTIIVPDLGVTAFRFWSGDNYHEASPRASKKGSYPAQAQRSVIRDLVISRHYLGPISDKRCKDSDSMEDKLKCCQEEIRKAYYNQFATGDLKTGDIGKEKIIRKNQNDPSSPVIIHATSREISNYRPLSRDNLAACKELENDEKFKKEFREKFEKEFSEVFEEEFKKFEIKRWQLISIENAGPEVRLTARVNVVSIDTINRRVNFEVIDGMTPDIYEGAYVKIKTAGISNPSKIIKVGTFEHASPPHLAYDGFIIHYEDNAGSEPNIPKIDATNCEVHLVCDLLARVTDIDLDNNSLIIDTHEDFQGISLFNLKIRHADAGIDMMARARCENILIYGMRGPAFAVIADNESIPLSNANNFQIENCLIHDCEYGLYILGRDTNDGTTINFANLPFVNPPQLINSGIEKFKPKWGIADLSFLGNAHVAPHFSGGQGAITRGGGTNRSVFIRPYHEGGTISIFGETTTGIGGELRYDQGGHSWTDGVFNDITIGTTHEAPAFSNYERIFRPKSNFELYRAKDSLFYYKFCKTAIKDEGGQEENTAVPGWYMHKHTGKGLIPFCWSDDNAIAGPGHFWVPGGISLGRNEDHATLSEDNRRTLTYGASLEDIEKREKFITPKKGDIVFNSNPDSEPFAGWICIDPLRPDIRLRWRPFGRIELS